VVHTNPYSSSAAALVFVCSITGVVAPSYEIDGIGGRLDWMHPTPEVSTLLYIGGRDRVTKRVIGLKDCFLVCYTICITESKLSSRYARLGLP
jgi:hypothetical protein